MDYNKGFSSRSCRYMLLKPEAAKFFDLIQILFSADLKKRKFIDTTEAKEESFEFRLLILISIVIQKMLRFFSAPLSFLGFSIEMWLNLLNDNGNSFRLFLNVFTGKQKIPDKTSATFVSFIGNFDRRVELDRNIRPGDPRYQAALSVMASKASYENHAYLKTIVNDDWKMQFLGSYDYWNDYQEKATTHVFIFRDKPDENEKIIVAFRGTQTFDADACCYDLDASWYELQGIGRFHGGFMKALGLQKNIGWPKEDINDQNDSRRRTPLAYYSIREILRELLSKNDKAKYILTGHSSGGALAVLFPAILEFHDEKMLLEKLQGVYTFGQPKAGDENFGKYMENMFKRNGIAYYRFVYSNDLVARVPSDHSALKFKHFGTCLYFNRHYQAKVVPEEPNKNYFAPCRAIPMALIAFMELIRSFTISYSKGAEFREGWLMRLFRLIGLLIPGAPAHSATDYANATRLGSPDVFLPTVVNGFGKLGP